MPFDAAEFNSLALWLIDQRTDESSLRTAISRVYYAGHLLAVQGLKRKKGWEPKGTGENHRGVILELRAGTTRGLSDRLNQLRMLREHADYHLDASESTKSRLLVLQENSGIITLGWGSKRDFGSLAERQRS